MTQKSCIVMGAGDATGEAVARRFARGGYAACLVRRARHGDQLEVQVQGMRDEGMEACAYVCDGREEGEVEELFAFVEKNIGPVGVAVFNIGANVRFPIREMTARVYRKVWEMGCYAGFLFGREAARVMVPRGEGSIFFTGATASVRGGEGYAAFAGAKFGLRALSQSMARELGKWGIHVAHLVVDGAIDTAFIRDMFPERYALKDREGILRPREIAEIYWSVHVQHRSAWTHELDVRPWMEEW